MPGLIHDASWFGGQHGCRASHDLKTFGCARLRLLCALASPTLNRRAASRCDGPSFLWVAAHKEDRRTRRLRTRTRKISKLKPHRDRLLELRRNENDLTLEAPGERFMAAHGVAADKTMLLRFFVSEGTVSQNRPRQRAGMTERYCRIDGRVEARPFRCGKSQRLQLIYFCAEGPQLVYARALYALFCM